MADAGKNEIVGNDESARPDDDIEDDDMESPSKTSQTPLLSPSARVRNIIEDGQETTGPLKLTNRTLFTQLDVLVHFETGQTGWKEMARWLKYQETVDSGDRWSKPHVPTGSMHSLAEMRRVISDGRCALGLGLSAENPGPNYIGEALVETLKKSNRNAINDRQGQMILETVLKPHKHMHRKKSSKQPSASEENWAVPNYNKTLSVTSENNNEDKARKSMLRRRSGDGKDLANCYLDYPHGTNPDNLKPYKPNKHLGKKLPKNTESANILVGQVDYLQETVIGFCRFNKPVQMAYLTEVDVETRFIFVVLGPTSTTSIWELTELGRAMGSLLNDKVFCEVAYKAKTRQDLLDAIDEFIDDLTVLPPSIWDSNTRLEPPSQTRSMDKILLRLDDSKRQKGIPTAPPQEEGASDDASLIRTGRVFGGLIYDVKSRYKYYLSDLKDGLHIQCIASTIFLFFACITPIVTFGGLMGQKTDGYMGTMETLMSGAICGVLYAVFAGQPLTIIGATGPLLIFESILYRLCNDNHIDFMSVRLWVGIWVAIALMFIVMFDLSFLVRFITRFTEESFSILISVIFIYEAFMKIYEIYAKNLVHTGVTRQDPGLSCFCLPSEWMPWSNSTNSSLSSWNDTDGIDYDNSTYMGVPSNWTYYYREECVTLQRRLIVKTGCISEKLCLKNGGELTGSACFMANITHAVPDVFFISVILFFGTFALAMAFRNFRTSPFFPSRLRSTVADFAVFLSLLSWTAIDYMFGVPTPKLNVPEEFVTTRSDRGWFINPGAITYGWLIPLTIIPALLATILVFLDQQITSVIVNRREHKLKKGHGYHLDLFVLCFLILICSFMGLPWFVAATVRALTHVKSLVRVSEVSVPGERPQMLGIREQRVTGICIHLLIGFSILITKVLRLIPMPVLYGVFLYMGITSLGDVQFIERIQVMFMPMKYQPDYIFLRHVKVTRVHIFTVIQLISFITMWIIKSVKTTAIAFPIMLIALMTIRKALDYVFTQTELYWLDHLLPDEHRRAAEDHNHAIEEGFDQKNGDKHMTKAEEAMGRKA